MERVLNNYTHLRGKYLGCFCKDEMDKLLSRLKTNIIQEVNPRAFALINTADSHTGGEHWMGLIINKTTNWYVVIVKWYAEIYNFALELLFIPYYHVWPVMFDSVW